MASLLIILLLNYGPVSDTGTYPGEGEKEKISSVIHSSIEWAINKDTTLLFNSFVQDTSLFFFNPGRDSETTGFSQFADYTRNVFMNPSFKAVGSDIRELRINISESKTVAWFSCYLDDYNLWDGSEANWIDCRWTGVLIKHKGQWKIAQMHFSFAT